MRYLIILLLLSCSLPQKQSSIETVSIDKSEQSQLSIEDKQDSTYGPHSDEQIEKVENEKKAILSLSVYSSLYSSLALLELLKNLEKEHIRVSVLRANGFASVICALYAKEESSNVLEWKLFKLLKKLKSKKPYSNDWKEIVFNFIDDEFKNLQLKQLKILFHLPDLEEGSVSKMLKKNLQLTQKSNYFHKPHLFKKNLMEQPSDLHFNITFLPKQIKFKVVDGYSWGILTNYFGFLKHHQDQIHTINADGAFAVDELLPLSEVVQPYKPQIKEFVQKIVDELQKWKEENSTSS